MLAFLNSPWFIWAMIGVIIVAFRCLWLGPKLRGKFCRTCAIRDNESA